MPNADLTAIIRRFITEMVPFNAHLGLQLEEVRHGHARLLLPFRPEFVGDPFRPALHGGLTAVLIDSCGGAAAATVLDLADRMSTIDLRVDYLQPARLEPLVADGRVLRVGNRLCWVDVRVYHPGAPEHAIAQGRVVYNIRRGAPAPEGPQQPR